jgi:hypothetical protein
MFKVFQDFILKLAICQFLVTPTASPKGSYRRSASEDQQPRDAITLNAVSHHDCACGVKEKQKETTSASVKSSSPEEEVFQHAPTSYCPKASEKE